MSRSTTTLAALAVAVLVFSLPSLSQAGCSSGYGGYSYGGYGYGYVSHHVYKPVVYHRPIVHRPIIHRPIIHRPVVVQKVIVEKAVDQCHHPHHCYTWVHPGDTLDLICEREYGNRDMWRRVAEYNRITTVLPTDRPLLLPSIYDSGRMVASTAPAPTLAPGLAPGAPLAASTDTIPAAPPAAGPAL